MDVPLPEVRTPTGVADTATRNNGHTSRYDYGGLGSNILDQEQSWQLLSRTKPGSKRQPSQFQALWINIGKCEGLINIGNRIPGSRSMLSCTDQEAWARLLLAILVPRTHQPM